MNGPGATGPQHPVLSTSSSLWSPVMSHAWVISQLTAVLNDKITAGLAGRPREDPKQARVLSRFTFYDKVKRIQRTVWLFKNSA